MRYVKGKEETDSVDTGSFLRVLTSALRKHRQRWVGERTSERANVKMPKWRRAKGQRGKGAKKGCNKQMAVVTKQND